MTSQEKANVLGEHFASAHVNQLANENINLTNEVKNYVLEHLSSPNITAPPRITLRRIIPKTPAYMGLNLSLRGYRIVPKSNKKDKIRITQNKSVQTFMNLTRNNSPLRSKQHSPVIMDLIDCLNLKPKNGQETEDSTKTLRRHLVYKRPITLSSLSRARVGQRRSLLRHESDLEQEIKPDLISHHIESLSKLNIQKIEESTLCLSEIEQKIQHKKFICLGNKLNDTSLELEKIYVSQTNLSKQLKKESNERQNDEIKQIPFHKCKNIDSDISTIRAKIRKIPSTSRPSSSVSQTETIENSKFFAVGLSLKAWRAKYNCILKAKNEIQPRLSFTNLELKKKENSSKQKKNKYDSTESLNLSSEI
uniref:CSON011425 protein n=1 Tax=Culicoides sonorensis TaxID=179676 RepID=A0A336M8V2_CULSO